MRYETMFGSPRDLVVKQNVLQRQKGVVRVDKNGDRILTLPPYSITKTFAKLN
ncbi:MAG: hypothetical protein AAGE96_01095 [Cyanobacteria bacterium P01_G01_bin.19]